LGIRGQEKTGGEGKGKFKKKIYCRITKGKTRPGLKTSISPWIKTGVKETARRKKRGYAKEENRWGLTKFQALKKEGMGEAGWKG